MKVIRPATMNAMWRARCENTRSLGRLRFRQPVLFDARVQLRAGEPQQLRGAGLVVPRLCECTHHQRALDIFEVDAAGRQWTRWRVVGLDAWPRRSDGQMLAANEAAIGEDHGAFDRVTQLTDVARPCVG